MHISTENTWVVQRDEIWSMCIVLYVNIGYEQLHWTSLFKLNEKQKKKENLKNGENF